MPNEKRSDSRDRRLEFMSRRESNKLILLGLGFLFLVFYLIQGSFAPKAEDVGVPVPLPVNRGPWNEPSGIPTVRPSQDPRAVLEALQAQEAGGAAQVTSADYVYDPARLRTVKDLELDVVEEPAFYHLLARVHFLSDAQIERAPEELGSFDYADLRPPANYEKGDFSHLDRVRGKFIRLEGRFKTHLFQRVLEKYPNESGLAWVWQGTFVSSNRGYFVTITDKTFDPKLGYRGDAVVLTGAFLKLYSFQPSNSKLSPKGYPHLIVKSIHKAPPREKWDYMLDEKLWVGIGAFGLVVLLVYFYAVSSRKSARQVDAWRQGRFSKRARRELAERKAERPGDSQPGEGGGGVVEDPPPSRESKPPTEDPPAEAGAEAAAEGPPAEAGAEAAAEGPPTPDADPGVSPGAGGA